VLWKLFRLGIGALGLGLGVGPDRALGTLFCEPEVPEMGHSRRRSASGSSGAVDDCEVCRQAEDPSG
jgi:hypothetical protein